jgi:chaperonin cofactor prefoldin
MNKDNETTVEHKLDEYIEKYLNMKMKCEILESGIETLKIKIRAVNAKLERLTKMLEDRAVNLYDVHEYIKDIKDLFLFGN